ncbi:MAG: sugar transferase [Patescibacteria group bacterium]|jgi:lipopolysaccharide/colanic/teichoic acid biosynthesis glycosyltransferase
MSKEIFDKIFSFLGLIFFLPLFLLIGVLIKIDSRGPIFYRGVRTGRFGKPFRIYKFRTMVTNAEKIGGPTTANNDSRVTKIGKFLRKYKIDELPQLINIFCGEMSFVGPRPQVEECTKRYNEKEKIILSVKPGLTDYASIEFVNLGEILGDGNVYEKYLREVEPKINSLRIKYIRERSFWVDIKIIFLTFLKILKKIWNIKN